jgi:hypothetical protein
MPFSFAKSIDKTPGIHFDRSLETIEDAVRKLRDVARISPIKAALSSK